MVLTHTVDLRTYRFFLTFWASCPTMQHAGTRLITAIGAQNCVEAIIYYWIIAIFLNERFLNFLAHRRQQCGIRCFLIILLSVFLAELIAHFNCFSFVRSWHCFDDPLQICLGVPIALDVFTGLAVNG